MHLCWTKRVMLVVMVVMVAAVVVVVVLWFCSVLYGTDTMG